jgi:2-aminoadipate transaminase
MALEWKDYFADRTKHISGSQIRQFFALTEREEVISFAGGFPGNEFFPLEDISEALSRLVRDDGRKALQYGPTEGSYELRQLLAKKMNAEKISCEAANLVITDGSQQGLDLLSRILINEDDAVLVEEPAYIGGMSAIKSYGGVPVGIPIDAEGPVPRVMEETITRLIKDGRRPKVFYTVPNFQNPTGITTSQERRAEVLNIAYRYKLLIIEDNPYGDLCYEGKVPASYKSLDTREQVIYLGSYSKILIPGIRIGWMAGPEKLIEKVTLAKQTADLCSSSLGQQLAYCLTVDGFIDEHTRKLIKLYQVKRDAMVEAMEKYFPSTVEFTRPKGGFFIWVTFPHYYPTGRELLELALKHNIAFVHGEGFSSNGGGSHSARFSFSQPSAVEITAGIKTFGRLLHEFEGRSSLKAVGQ